MKQDHVAKVTHVEPPDPTAFREALGNLMREGTGLPGSVEKSLRLVSRALAAGPLFDETGKPNKRAMKTLDAIQKQAKHYLGGAA